MLFVSTSSSCFITDFRALSLAVRALNDLCIFSRIRRSTSTFLSRYRCTSVLNTSSTAFLASVLPSLFFVWLSNCGSGCLMDTIATIPLRISFPSKLSSLFFRKFNSLAYWFITLVSAVLNPVTRVPPSATLIRLQYELICSL